MLHSDEIAFIQNVRNRVSETMIGLEDVTGALLCALFTGGHVLLEGNPGLGKTALVRALGDALGLQKQRVGRIQFTPDLMPSDITGTERPVWDESGAMRLEFTRGPIFHWLLIADEINRATPKTQAAMLEAMAEKQVTVLGQTFKIAELQGNVNIVPPFLVMATQNPIDQEGTYDLPEAQADRFMFKVKMPFPSYDTLSKILLKDAGPPKSEPDITASAVDETEALKAIDAIRSAVRRADIPARVETHILNIVLGSNGVEDDDMELQRAERDALRQFRDNYLAYELGPRAATSMMLGTKGWSAVMLTEAGENEIGSKAADALNRIALPVLRHRLKFRFGWERRFREEFDIGTDVADDELLDRAIARFVSLAAPGGRDYQRNVLRSLNASMAQQI